MTTRQGSSERNRGTQAIITGGAQGLGLAVARQLAAEGCRAIALVGRTKAKGAAAVAELEEHGFARSSSRPMSAASTIVSAP